MPELAQQHDIRRRVVGEAVLLVFILLGLWACPAPPERVVEVREAAWVGHDTATVLEGSHEGVRADGHVSLVRDHAARRRQVGQVGGRSGPDRPAEVGRREQRQDHGVCGDADHSPARRQSLDPVGDHGPDTQGHQRRRPATVVCEEQWHDHDDGDLGRGDGGPQREPPAPAWPRRGRATHPRWQAAVRRRWGRGSRAGNASMPSMIRSRETGLVVKPWTREAWARMIIWNMRGPAASSVGPRRSAAVAAPLSSEGPRHAQGIAPT